MLLRIGFVVLTCVVLSSCDSGREIKLLSENNSHMLYLYPNDKSAELYTGVSLVADYQLKLNSKDVYLLKAKSDQSNPIEFMFDSNTGNWKCSGCIKQELSSQWVQQ